MENNHSLPLEGWYPDPNGVVESERFWNGAEWTNQTRNKSVSSKVFPATGETYAGWWTRAGATIVDNLILFPLYLIIVGGLAFILIVSLYSEDFVSLTEGELFIESDYRLSIISFFVVACIALIYFFYQVILIGVWGKTVGDRVAGIRIASQKNGNKPSFSEASGRTLVLVAFYLGTFLPVIGLVFYVGYLLNFFSMLWDSKSRCWHDLLGGTVVLKSK